MGGHPRADFVLDIFANPTYDSVSVERCRRERTLLHLRTIRLRSEPSGLARAAEISVRRRGALGSTARAFLVLAGVGSMALATCGAAVARAHGVVRLKSRYARVAYLIYPAPTSTAAKRAAKLALGGTITTTKVAGGKVTLRVVIPMPPGQSGPPPIKKVFPASDRIYAVDAHSNDDRGDDTNLHDGDFLLVANRHGTVVVGKVS